METFLAQVHTPLYFAVEIEYHPHDVITLHMHGGSEHCMGPEVQPAAMHA